MQFPRATENGAPGALRARGGDLSGLTEGSVVVVLMWKPSVLRLLRRPGGGGGSGVGLRLGEGDPSLESSWPCTGHSNPLWPLP